MTLLTPETATKDLDGILSSLSEGDKGPNCLLTGCTVHAQNAFGTRTLSWNANPEYAFAHGDGKPAMRNHSIRLWDRAKRASSGPFWDRPKEICSWFRVSFSRGTGRGGAAETVTASDITNI